CTKRWLHDRLAKRPAKTKRLTGAPLVCIIRYILLRGRTMQTAKVFMNGRSQAIRLPKEFRVESAEVYLKKTPEGFLVIPRDPWEVFFEGVEELSEDFMAHGRPQPPAQRRKWKA